ncbi:hypothetical protein NEMIN01_2363 [Nematocida minor]|uniref:uncharacterized protein n=1 Tax=Nematocida minor TaxID=1912983 RepID=UPI00221F4339|nr:uncharacterized protein NEMIN01_2363 [Nematocida minor]KAI5193019.1 hypothetical protein NEMIN01_2363 [Nematocida minor]
MKTQKLKKMLGAGAALLSFFIIRCRGSWSVFDEDAPSNSADPWIGGERTLRQEDAISDDHLRWDLLDGRLNLTDYTADEYEQFGQKEYIPEYSTDKSVFAGANSIAEPPRAEDGRIEDGLDLGCVDPEMGSSIFSDVYRTFEGPQRVEEQCMLDTSNNKNMACAHGTKSAYSASTSLDKGSIWSQLPLSIGEMKQLLLPCQEDVEISGIGKDAFCETDDSYARSDAGQKRKAGSINSSMNVVEYSSMAPNKRGRKEGRPKERYDAACGQESVEIMMADRKGKGAAGIPMRDLNTNLWNSIRLKNTGRRGYKISYNTLCESKCSKNRLIYMVKNEMYQTKLKIDISEFLEYIAPVTEKNALCYFIASRTTNTNTKYKDLLGLKRLFMDTESIYRKMVESFAGYYPGVLDDMIAYVEKHEPMRINAKNPPTVWKKSLGDIYMSDCLEMNYALGGKQGRIGELKKKYHTLAYAVHMLAMLPEVSQDFSRISDEFIEETYTSESIARNKKNCQILLRIKRIVQMHKEERIDESVYNALYCIFENMYGEEAVQKSTAVGLYRAIYTLLAKFYEKAAVIEKKNKYVLAGKCIIKNQMHMKCKVAVDTAAEDRDRRLLSPEYSFEENRWVVAPDAPAHYHVYYVENTLGQVRVLCMPMYKEPGSGEEFYVHTIGDTVAYIKQLYGIKDSSDVVHPFKVNRETKEWSYIKTEEGYRKQTVKDLRGHEVVFYHIEEDIRTTKFTFAEFRSLNPYSEEVIFIPLFLTPLMRSAVGLGLFVVMAEEHKEMDSIKFENREPDTYVYDYKYMGPYYLDMYTYYNNLYILPNRIQNAECYSMCCQLRKEENGTLRAVWHVKVPGGADEYTHCVPSKEFEREGNAREFNAFITAVESREYNKDSQLQGFWLSEDSTQHEGAESQTYKICVWPSKKNSKKSGDSRSLENIETEMVETQKKIEEIEKRLDFLRQCSTKETTEKVRLEKDALRCKRNRKAIKLGNLREEREIKVSKRPKSAKTGLIVFRNVNPNRSNLGAHNEILNVFITSYRQQHKAQ